MPGQAIVTISNKQWACSVANIFTEITTGLSSVESLDEAEGMLFDLGADYSQIDIDMSRMLFPLDIIFINSNQGVVGVLHDVQPGEEASLSNETLPGARFFLEINAGEAEGIEVGDEVQIQGYVTENNLSPIMSYLPIFMVLIMGMTMVS